MKKILLLIFIMLIGPGIYAQSSDYIIDGLTARPGERVSGYIEIPDGIDEGTKLPITISHGTKPGPVLLLIAGVHGSELSPIMALQRLSPLIDERKLSGTIIMVYSANPPSFFKRTVYYSPIDGKNLNRVFPGKADGTQTERIAHTLMTKFIARADYVIDIHSGDGNEALYPYLAIYLHASAPEHIEQVKAMALSFGIQHIKKISGRSSNPHNSIYLTNAAHIAGKYVMAIECGELGQADDKSVTTIVNGLINVTHYLQMLPGKVSPIKNPVWLDHDETVRSNVTGIFYPLVKVGQMVKKGEQLGYVTDFFGKNILKAFAPFDGKVMFIVNTPPVSNGEPLASITRIAQKKLTK